MHSESHADRIHYHAHSPNRYDKFPNTRKRNVNVKKKR